MEIYTVQMSKFRLAQTLGIPTVDITVRSGRPEFAPDWNMVMDLKRGQLTSEEYAKRYREKMLLMYNLYRPEWQAFLKRPKVAVMCYCPAGVFCHRHLLVDIMEKLTTRLYLPFYRGGEIISVEGVQSKRLLDGRAPLTEGTVAVDA